MNSLFHTKDWKICFDVIVVLGLIYLYLPKSQNEGTVLWGRRSRGRQGPEITFFKPKEAVG